MKTQFSIKKDGIKLSPGPDTFTWDENTRTLFSGVSGLVLNFHNEPSIKFITGSDCTFYTGGRCRFITGHRCTFETNEFCVFDTESKCTFTTGSKCLFDTHYGCTFSTRNNCTFRVGKDCVFDTGPNCIIINKATNEIIRLDNKLNHYDMKIKQIQHELDDLKLNIFKNHGKPVYNLNLQTENIQDLRPFLPQEDYNNLLKEIFEKMT